MSSVFRVHFALFCVRARYWSAVDCRRFCLLCLFACCAFHKVYLARVVALFRARQSVMVTCPAARLRRHGDTYMRMYIPQSLTFDREIPMTLVCDAHAIIPCTGEVPPELMMCDDSDEDM